MSSQVLTANKMLGTRVLAANEDGDVRSGDRSSNRSKRMEPKT